MTITVRALADMLRIHEAGEPPLAIAPDPMWHDPTADRYAAEAAWREFTEVDLVRHRGQLTDGALDTLRLLGRPDIEYIGIVLTGDRQSSVVVAALGDDAVIAQRTGNIVKLTSTPHHSLPDALLDRIPQARPAPIDAVNVRVTELNGPTGQLRGRKLVRQGELYVSVRDAYGRRRRSGPVRFQDYRIGRVVVVIGGGYLSVAPASQALLRDRLLAAHRENAGYDT